LLSSFIIVASFDDFLESSNRQFLIFGSIDFGRYPVNKIRERLEFPTSDLAVMESLGTVTKM
jgi:hypothetical protein